MGVLRAAPRRGPGHTRWLRAVAIVGAVTVGTAACASDVRDLGYADAPVDGGGEAPAELALQAPSPTATAAPTPTPIPTPTAIPTPTPTPEPIVATRVIRRTIEDGFAALDELDAIYSYALHVDGLGYVDVRRPVLELRPASNQKVVTAVGALELLPKEFRFVTVMRLDEDRRLYVQAGGDPTLTQADVRGMIDDVVAYLAPPSDQPVPEAAPADPEEDSGGVVVESRPPVEIADLVIDPSYFDDTRTAPGWPDRYVPVDVGPMSALIIDDNQHRGDDDFIADPDRGNAELISALLEDAGVVVTGSVSVGPTSPDAVVVAEHRSSPLRRLVSLILSTSDNEIADALVRQIARDHAGTSSIVDGKQVIYDRVAALGVELGPVDGDGSGLSRRNRLSARELVEVLLVARERPWWTIMRTGLANARVDVRLSERLEVTTPLGNVRAKTGTLIDVAALSGDLTTADGGEVTFSLIIEAEDRDAARDALDEIVAALTTATVSQLAG